jgi:putative intracellular protease/amidase
MWDLAESTDSIALIESFYNSGIFEKAPNWQPFSIVDGHLITGQNPASSTVAAQALLKTVG